MTKGMSPEICGMPHLANNVVTDAAPRGFFFAAQKLLYRISESIAATVATRLLDWHARAYQARKYWRANAPTYRVYDLINAGPRHRFATAQFVVVNCTLGLGYQAGANKFEWLLTTSDTVPVGTLDRVRKPGESNADVARRLVNTYRESNPKIVALWKTLHHELLWACETNGDATIQTPTGRTVYYRGMHRASRRKANSAGVVEDRIAMVGSPCRGEPPRDLYGGKVAENLCQGTARDVVAECIWRAEAAGIPVSFTVHDELVTHVPATEAEDARKALEELMSVTPEWLPGCPIAAEAATMERYAK